MLLLIDAFADGPFTGNPAAVCVLSETAASAWMQGLAMELNQAETAFVQRRSDGDWDLRWFTPTTEVDLCGHATLATAHGLWESHLASGPLRFHTRSGILTCRPDGDGVAMDFPAIPARPTTPPDDLDVAVGARLIAVWQAGPDLLVEVDDAATVRDLQPDLAAIATLPVRGLIVCARGDDGVHDVVSRFFAPQSGIPEDPVTGSAHCALGPLWSARLRRATVVGRQCSRRGGTVRVTCHGDRVSLSGRARTVLRGTLAL